MKENRYPVDASGKPDLSYYRDSAAYYAAMHEEYRRVTRTRGHDSSLEFARRVHACWGLIAQGRASIPYALDMLRSGDASAREDAGGILAEIGKDPVVTAALLDQLAGEDDIQARDSLVMALGALKAREAIPALARLIRDESTDPDTRWTAMESLGKIARRRFDRMKDPIGAATAWLDKTGVS